MSKAIVIFLLPFLFISFLFSQNCDCKDSKQIYDQLSKLNKEKKVTEIFEFVNAIEKKGNKACIGIAANHAATLLAFKIKSEKCLEILKRVGGLLNESCLDTIRAQNYFLIGRNYFNLGSMDSSQAYYIRSAELAERIKAYEIQVNALSDICWVLQNFGQDAKAMSYLKKALAISLRINDTKEVGILYSNLAAAYGGFYEATKNEKYLDSTVSSLNSALELHRKEKNEQSIQFIYVTFANVYLAKNEHKRSLAYCDSVTKMGVIDDYNRYIIHSIKSNVYKQKGNKLLALSYADSCYQVAANIVPPYELVNVIRELVQCYKDVGNTQMALELTEKLIKFKDSTKTIEVNAKVSELEQKYNKAQNEKTIKELSQENELVSLRSKFLSVGVLAAILVIMVIIFFYRQSVLKNKFKALETEQRLNRARMNPHFFFNALASIQTLSLDQKNQSKVSSLISQFSRIMRQSLESTYDELTTIEEEVSFLTNYLTIQKVRFPDKFEFEIKVEEGIEQDELRIPGMLLQPFIENSIEHGFKNIDHKGKLDILVSKQDKELLIFLKDNGKGFEINTTSKEYPSRATQIVSDRLLILNKQYHSNARYELSKNESKGVSVSVFLPVIYKNA